MYLVVVFHLMVAMIPLPYSTSPTEKTQIADMTHHTTQTATKKKNIAGIAKTLGVVPTKSAAASTIETPS